MDNRPDETQVCPRCNGSGKIESRAAHALPIGTKVWWNFSGNYCWGYTDRIPATVVGHSKSGKTVRIRYPILKDWNGTALNGEEMVNTVAPRFLETRHECPAR